MTKQIQTSTASEQAQANVREAFAWFNEQLWDNQLPIDTVVFWHRQPKANGYFGPHRFKNDKGVLVSELALNPDWLGKRTDLDILSTLVHEMCHLERLLLDPGDWPGAYHCQKWVDMMERVGLIPVAMEKGKRNGKKTGYSVTHDIDEDGLFLIAAEKFLASHPHPFPLRAIDAIEAGIMKNRNLKKSKPTSGGSRTSKLSFHCPHCDTRIYGKADTKVYCFGPNEEKQHEQTLFVMLPKKADRK